MFTHFVLTIISITVEKFSKWIFNYLSILHVPWFHKGYLVICFFDPISCWWISSLPLSVLNESSLLQTLDVWNFRVKFWSKILVCALWANGRMIFRCLSAWNFWAIRIAVIWYYFMDLEIKDTRHMYKKGGKTHCYPKVNHF